MEPAELPSFYRVIVNRAGCYCIWPSNAEMPGGWMPIGFSSSATTALRQVAELWRMAGAEQGRSANAREPSGDAPE